MKSSGKVRLPSSDGDPCWPHSADQTHWDQFIGEGSGSTLENVLNHLFERIVEIAYDASLLTLRVSLEEIHQTAPETGYSLLAEELRSISETAAKTIFTTTQRISRRNHAMGSVALQTPDSNLAGLRQKYVELHFRASDLAQAARELESGFSHTIRLGQEIRFQTIALRKTTYQLLHLSSHLLTASIEGNPARSGQWRAPDAVGASPLKRKVSEAMASLIPASSWLPF